MQRRSALPVILVSLVAALSAPACLLDPEKIGATTLEATSGASGTSGTSETSETTETTDATATGGTTSSALMGRCIRACDDVADCCAGVGDDCPGPYPLNYSCVDGACDYGGCVDDSECQPGRECHQTLGRWTCTTPCEIDADCGPYPGLVACLESEDGVPVCTSLKPPGYGCKSDDECNGAGICNLETGDCECAEEGHCAREDLTCGF